MLQNVLSPNQGWLLLAAFWIAMMGITYGFARWKNWNTREGFLLAERNVGWVLGGASIAAAWIWAGALLVSSQLAYEKGLAGLFWFLVPNVMALLIFAWLGPKIRQTFVRGYTLPQFIRYRFENAWLHRVYLSGFLIYQLICVAFNVFAGGTLIGLLTGIPPIWAMAALAFISLSYTLISGMEASVVTDALQMLLMLFGVAILVPARVNTHGSIQAVIQGLRGVSGNGFAVFDPAVMFSPGLVTSIGLISSTVIDQQDWQRVFSIKREKIAKAYALGALLFAAVPLGLSLLGFFAASPNSGVVIPAGTDHGLVGLLAIQTLLPPVFLLVFAVIILCGVLSTIDSAQSATSALWVTDVIATTKQEQTLLDQDASGSVLKESEKPTRKFRSTSRASVATGHGRNHVVRFGRGGCSVFDAGIRY